MLTPQEQETLETYNQIAVGWAKTLRSDFWLKEYEKFFSFLPAGKILDLGCGNGRDSLWFTGQGLEVVGIDISEEMVKLAKAANPKAAFYVQSFYALDFPIGTFDGFWAACSLMHVPKEKIKGILSKVMQVLRAGAIGFVAVKEGSGQRMMEWQDSGKKRYFVYYTREEFAEILKTGGFEILEIAKRPPRDAGQDGTFLVYYVRNK